MATTLLVGDARSCGEWADILRRERHSVEICEGSLGFQERFEGPPADIFIVDVTHANWGEAMLIPQARAAWPKCRILAIASGYAFRSSAVYQMGLWTPDQLLIKPVNPRVLCATVAFMWAQIRSEEIRRLITAQPLTVERDKDDEPTSTTLGEIHQLPLSG